MAAESSCPDLVWIDESSLQDWKVIGSGGFGQIFKARHLQWGWDVAIKLLHHDDGSSPALLRETKLMRQAEGRFVTRVLGAFKGRPPSVNSIQFGLVMEFMERGSLASLQDTLNQPLPIPLVCRLAHQVAMGMNYLHCLTPSLLHLDLKPSNVLLDTNLNIKLTDFGLSKLYHSVSSKMDAGMVGGTIYYMPPEAFNTSYKPTCASDTYSYGILLWTIVTGERPYAYIMPSVVQSCIPMGDRPSLVVVNQRQAPGLEDLAKLMERCWHGEPAQRPLFRECTAVTEALYEKNRHGINGIVNQVLMKLDQQGEERLTEIQITTPLGASATHQNLMIKTKEDKVAEKKLKSVRVEFIERVSEPILKSVLDRLLDKNVLNDQEMEFIRGQTLRADKAREVIDMVRKKGDEASLELIDLCHQLDPKLSEQLEFTGITTVRSDHKARNVYYPALPGSPPTERQQGEGEEVVFIDERADGRKDQRSVPQEAAQDQLSRVSWCQRRWIAICASVLFSWLVLAIIIGMAMHYSSANKHIRDSNDNVTQLILSQVNQLKTQMAETARTPTFANEWQKFGCSCYCHTTPTEWKTCRSTTELLYPRDNIIRVIKDICGCNINCYERPMELVFIIDSSESIGPEGFEEIKDFVLSFLDSVTIGHDATRIGMVVYSFHVDVVFNLGRYKTKERIEQAIRKIQFIGEGAFPGTAIRKATREVFNQARNQVRKVAIVITEGIAHPRDPVDDAAREAHAANIEMYAVGTLKPIEPGDYVLQQLNLIASDPDSEHMYLLDDYNTLPALRAKILSQFCPGVWTFRNLPISHIIVRKLDKESHMKKALEAA